ncbi:mixed lineage kinase domain-like protein isoform X2 [Alosa sapidissima]|uniref:mixed lineage kinase domain-like protein isoform X2 n=1 Tax=Alosa sapidissima TaxID=34773 RepID=UPI001C094CC6|nr:mixed lineage kinase domain-like protein isoform X2 [Alosa sapidissima]
MDIISTLLDVAEKLYSQCQKVQDNKDQCGRLGGFVSSLKDVLQSLLGQDPSRRPPDLDARLANLGTCFEDAEQLVVKYGSTSSLSKFFHAKAMDEEFQGVFKRLEDLRQLLSLSLQVEQRGQVQSMHNVVNRAEDKIDLLHEKMDKLIQNKEVKGPETLTPVASSLDAAAALGAVRSRFVEKASLPLLKQLLDELQTARVLNSEEAESVLEEQSARADRARCLIDTVRKKGRRASETMITHLRDKDPELAQTLGLA